MPLFVTTKKNSVTLNDITNKGNPLVFQTDEQHIYFANPDSSADENDKKLNIFHCEPLSISTGSTAGSSNPTINVTTGGSCNVLRQISVSDHIITYSNTKLTIGKETSVSVTSTANGNQNLEWGNTVTIGRTLTTGGTNGHTLTFTTNTLTMPDNPNSDNHRASHEFSVSSGKVILSNVGSDDDGSSANTDFTIAQGGGLDLHTDVTNRKISISHYTPTGAQSYEYGGSAGTLSVGNNVITGVYTDKYGHITYLKQGILGGTYLYVGEANKNTNANVTDPYIKLYDNTTLRNQYKISGTGATSVSSDANGNITIFSTDTISHACTHDLAVNQYGSNSNKDPFIALTNPGGNNTPTDSIQIAGAGATTVTRDNASKITISSTDEHTTEAGHYPPKDLDNAKSTPKGSSSSVFIGGNTAISQLEIDSKGHVIGFYESKLPYSIDSGHDTEHNFYPTGATYNNNNIVAHLNPRNIFTVGVSSNDLNPVIHFTNPGGNGTTEKTLKFISNDYIQITYNSNTIKFAGAGSSMIVGSSYLNMSLSGIIADSYKNSSSTNGNTYLSILNGGKLVSSNKISGTGATSVSSDANGNITISSNDTHFANHSFSWDDEGSDGNYVVISLSNTSSSGNSSTNFQVDAGTGISVDTGNDGFTISNTMKIQAGTGISVSSFGSTFTITNTAPDVNHNSHLSHGATISNGILSISNDSANKPNVVSWENSSPTTAGGPCYNIKVMTKSEYDKISKNANTLYLITG